MAFFDKLKSQATSAIKQAAGSAGTKTEKVVFSDLPETLEGFKALPQAAMSSPYDTAALAVVALCIFPSDKELCYQMVDFLCGPRPMTGVDKQFISDRFRGVDYIPRSHFDGATPANDYMPTSPYTVTVKSNQYTNEVAGISKLFIASGGADSPHPVQLRQAKDGKWYLWEYSSLLLGIRQPESSNPWA